MDKISEEFFTYLSRCIHGHRILMISPTVPRVLPPWCQGAHYQHLGLETLGFDASTRLVRNLLGGLPLGAGPGEEIVRQDRGEPLFMEEIVRASSIGGTL